MEVHPEKMDGTPLKGVPSIFFGYTGNSIQRKIITVISYHLIQNVINMSLNEFDVYGTPF